MAGFEGWAEGGADDVVCGGAYDEAVVEEDTFGRVWDTCGNEPFSFVQSDSGEIARGSASTRNTDAEAQVADGDGFAFWNQGKTAESNSGADGDGLRGDEGGGFEGEGGLCRLKAKIRKNFTEKIAERGVEGSGGGGGRGNTFLGKKKWKSIAPVNPLRTYPERRGQIKIRCNRGNGKGNRASIACKV